MRIDTITIIIDWKALPWLVSSVISSNNIYQKSK